MRAKRAIIVVKRKTVLSAVQMPPGVPVATVAIGGGRNAGLLAVQILGASDAALRARVLDFKRRQARAVRARARKLKREIAQGG